MFTQAIELDSETSSLKEKIDRCKQMIKYEKEQIAKGLVKYRGEWMTPEEKEELERKERIQQQLSNCYDLGYRWGHCSTLVFFGYECPPEDDFVMPEECRGMPSTERGLEAGVKSVYRELGIPTE